MLLHLSLSKILGHELVSLFLLKEHFIQIEARVIRKHSSRLRTARLLTMFRWPPLDVSTSQYKFGQVSSNGHQMSVAGGGVWIPFLVSGWGDRSHVPMLTEWLTDRHLWKHHLPIPQLRLRAVTNVKGIQINTASIVECLNQDIDAVISLFLRNKVKTLSSLFEPIMKYRFEVRRQK